MGLWSFVTRHKKKFITLTVVGGLGVSGYYYAKRLVMDGMRQVEELGRDLQEKMMESQNRESEKVRLNTEGNEMLPSFLPPLKKALRLLTDPKEVTEKLKKIRQQLALGGTSDEDVVLHWNELKVLSIGRLIAAVYGLGLLNGMLKIQLHVLGRFAFEEAANGRRSKLRSKEELVKPVVDRAVREKFLFASGDHFMGEGMKLLVDRVKLNIDSVSSDWVMGTDSTISRVDIVNKLDVFRGSLEGKTGYQGLPLSSSAHQLFVSCLVPKDETAMMKPDPEFSKEQNEVLVEMLQETLDMFESPVFTQVLSDSFSQLFDVLTRDVQCFEFSADSEEYLLTKVIVALKSMSERLFDEPSNEYFKALSNVPSLDAMCVAIFEQGNVDESDFGGLDSLGIGQEDLKSLAGLLGGGGEGDLMKLLGSLGGDEDLMKMMGGDNMDEAQLMQMIQAASNNLT